MAKKFIAGAIKRPGALTRKAKAAGQTVTAFAKKVVGRKPNGKMSVEARRTKRQAVLAQTLAKLRERITPAARRQGAKKAVATKRRRGIFPFGG